MAHELPPFRVTPEEWARVHVRRVRWPLGIVSGLVFLAIMWPVLVFLGLSPLWAFVSAVGVGFLSPWNHYFTTRDRLRKKKGLPWEEQRFSLDDEGFQTIYESGFEVRVPWATVNRIRRVPEGFLFELQGSGQCFLPAGAVDSEAEATILRHTPPGKTKR